MRRVSEIGHFLLSLPRDFPRRDLLLGSLIAALVVAVSLSPSDNNTMPALIAEPITISLESRSELREEDHQQLAWQEICALMHANLLLL